MINRFKILLGLLFFTSVSFLFLGGDCSTDPDPGAVNLSITNFTVDAVPGDSSFAVINWNNGTGEIEGFEINTYTIDDSNQIVSLFQPVSLGPNQNSVVVGNIQPGVKYQSYLIAILTGGTASDSVSTPVYSGIFYFTDGRIDEFTLAEPTESGFGWDRQTGVGTEYPFDQNNASVIDLHMRADSIETLYFFSPDQFNLSNANSTKILNIGTGEEAFDNSNLQEPMNDSAEVVADNVYLLKLQDGYYVKLWVKTIGEIISTPPYKTVQFEYKVQTIAELRIL
jgi:hypothetical protein